MTMKSEVHQLGKILKEKKLTIAFAESMTCGAVADSFANIPCTSAFFKGSIVCYHEQVKHKLLGVRQETLDRFTAESREVTDELAQKLPHLIEADIHAAVTGLAAPGGSETSEKPVGTVFFSIRYQQALHSTKRLYRGTPLQIRKKASRDLCRFIMDILA